MSRSPSPLPLDLDCRRPVWEALSELYLDTEPGPDDYRRIAGVLAASGYTVGELESILRYEVAPVLWPNLFSVAGVWASFDSAWLEAQILGRQQNRRWSLVSFMGMRLVRADWEAIKRVLGGDPS